jgi:DNA-binding NarL/FixJ family response regulator
MNILLADDQSRVRFALRILLEQQPGWKVVGEATDARELIAQSVHHQPDLVLLDGDLPGLERNDWLPALRKIIPGICIIALSEEQPIDAFDPAATADAFASKANPPEYLLAVIRNCMERREEENGHSRSLFKPGIQTKPG